MSYACVFAHYDKDNMIDDYIYFYLNELLSVVEKLIFVTVSDISNKDVEKLESLNISVIKRENIGYDFYSYKEGMERLSLCRYDNLIICNDSTFGPITSLKSIFNNMQDIECDFWGITDSELIAYHLQSYFLVFKKKILHSLVFQNFWDELKIVENKTEIIVKYEVGLSQLLSRDGYSSYVYTQYKINKRDNSIRLLKRLWTNPNKIFRFFVSPRRYYSATVQKKASPSTLLWEILIIKHKCPFIKKSILNKNEGYENMKKLRLLFSKKKLETEYPIALIENYYIRHNN